MNLPLRLPIIWHIIITDKDLKPSEQKMALKYADKIDV